MTDEDLVPLEALVARIEGLEREVKHLRDLEEIRTLRYRYHFLNNEGRSPEKRSLFTEDGEIDFGFMGQGTLNHFQGSTARSSFIRQFIHNHMVEIHGDTATGVSYQEGRAVFHGRAFRILGTYEDEYRRTPDGWRFRKMVFKPTLLMPADRSWARPEDRLVDPHDGVLERDESGNTIMPEGYDPAVPGSVTELALRARDNSTP